MTVSQYILLIACIAAALFFIVYLILQLRKVTGPTVTWKGIKESFKSIFNFFSYNRKRERVKEIFKEATQLVGKKHDASLYDYPVYILLGKEGSGKSTLVRDSGLYFPFGYPLVKEGDPCIIWISGKGIYIEINAQYEDGKLKETELREVIKFVFANLKKYRKRRKVDGLLFTFACAEIAPGCVIAQDDEDAELEMEDKKEDKKEEGGVPEASEELIFMNECLQTVSRYVTYQLPLYFTLTQSDKIQGLKLLADSIPEKASGQIFGWTNRASLMLNRIDYAVKHATESMSPRIDALKDYIFTVSDLQCKDRNAIFIKEYLVATLDEFKNKLHDQINIVIYGRDRYFVRGIYFVLRKDEGAATSDSAQMVFTKDLFSKLFVGDKAVAGNVVKSNTFKGAIKNSFVYLLVSIFLLFLFLGDYQSDKKIATLTQPLEHTASDMSQLASQKGDSSASWNRLYDTVSQKKWSIMSSWLPASWVSPLAISLPKMMSDIQTLLLTNVLYTAAQTKINEVLNMPQIVAKDLYTGNLQDFVKYQNLNQAVSDITSVLDFIKIYNSLSGSTSQEDINQLIKFVPGGKGDKLNFSKEQLNRISELRLYNKLKTFDYSKTKAALLEKLLMMFSEYGSTLINSWPLSSALNSANTILAQNQRSSFALVDVGRLKYALDSVNTVVGYVQGKQKMFTKQQMIDYGIGNYVRALNESLRNDLISQSQYKDYDKKYIKRFNEEVGKNITYSLPLSEQVFNYYSNFRGYALSQKFLSLYRAASFIVSYNFKIDFRPIEKQSTAALASGNFTINISQLSKVSDLTQKYADFNANKKKLKNPLDILYVDRIIKSTIDNEALRLLTNSIEPIPVSDLQAGGNQLLRSLISNINSAYPYFKSLTKNLGSLGMSETEKQVYNILSKMSVNTLSMLKTNILGYKLYIPQGDMSLGDAKQPLAFRAYDVTSTNDLKSYLDAQNQVMKSDGVGLAKGPLQLVDLVPGPIISLFDNNSNVVSFWQNTAKIFNMSQKNKTLKNSFGQLQDFILKGINKVQLSNCPAFLANQPTGNDFYTFTLRELKSQMYSMCTQQATTASTSKYDTILAAFSAYLMGNFPFVSPKNMRAESLPYATLSNFYFTYNKDLKFLLDMYKKRKDIQSKQKYAFLKKLNDSLNFLLANAKTNVSLPSFYVQMVYRINQTNEVGADQILNWNFSDTNGSISPSKPKNRILWQYGDPIAFELLWAADSPQLPKSPGSGDLSVSGPKATFSSSDPWSLLRLIAGHRTTMFPQNQKLGTSLSFVIPTQTNQTKGVKSIVSRPSYVRLYVGLKLLDAKTVKPLVMPEFPYNTPAALGNVKLVSTVPTVMTKGTAHKYPRYPGRYSDRYPESHAKYTEPYKAKKSYKSYSEHDMFSKNNPDMYRVKNEEVSIVPGKSHLPPLYSGTKRHYKKAKPSTHTSTSYSVPVNQAKSKAAGSSHQQSYASPGQPRNSKTYEAPVNQQQPQQVPAHSGATHTQGSQSTQHYAVPVKTKSRKAPEKYSEPASSSKSSGHHSTGTKPKSSQYHAVVPVKTSTRKTASRHKTTAHTKSRKRYSSTRSSQKRKSAQVKRYYPMQYSKNVSYQKYTQPAHATHKKTKHRSSRRKSSSKRVAHNTNFSSFKGNHNISKLCYDHRKECMYNYKKYKTFCDHCCKNTPKILLKTIQFYCKH